MNILEPPKVEILKKSGDTYPIKGTTNVVMHRNPDGSITESAGPYLLKTTPSGCRAFEELGRQLIHVQCPDTTKSHTRPSFEE